MMDKYLKIFESHSQYVEPEVKPNVSYCIQENEVHYDPYVHDYSQDYLTFEIVENGTINWMTYDSQTGGTLPHRTILYKLNDGNWTTITSTTSGVSFNVSIGDKVLFKGNNNTYCSNYDYASFRNSSAKFNISGNILSLIHGDNFIGQSLSSETFIFSSLFIRTNVISAKNLILPNSSLTANCYESMFAYCTSLTEAPVLSATTLVQGCYRSMFTGCTSLIEAPVLPAGILAATCYYGMFSGCTNLNYIKCLATNISADQCVAFWVSNVASSGTFVKAPSMTGWTTRIPSGWIVVNAA